MRNVCTRWCALLLALPFILGVRGLARAADTGGQSVLTSQQQEYIRLLQEEGRAFLDAYPAYRGQAAEGPDALAQRREQALLWQDVARAALDRARADAESEAAPAAAKKWKAPETGTEAASEAALLPNEAVSWSGPPEQNNASFSYHERIAAEAYGVWTEHSVAGFGAPPTQVWFGGTPAAGSGVPWPVAGAINWPVTPLTLPESWNPSMGAVDPSFTGDAYYAALSEWAAPALAFGSPSAIVVHTSLGSGLPIPSGTGPVAIFQGSPFTWVDYPYLVVDDVPGNMGPPGLGDVHVAWVEYLEGGDGDPDGNGVWYDDPADGYQLWVASANTGVGPMVYPAFGNYWLLWSGPVMPGMHQVHRPSLSVVGSGGTRPPVSIPNSGVYAAWYDFWINAIMIDASLQPGANAPWGALGPAPVPVPVAPLPPALNGNIKSATSVSIAVDNGPNFPGMVYLAWSDWAAGDADILFSSSWDGGLSWTMPVRVNQDPVGNALDQWAPHMVVDPVTGDITVTYYDRRNDPAANFLVETWASTSMDGGVTWWDAPVSDAGPVPPLSTLAVGPWVYIGDYLTSDANPLSKWGAVWNDGRNGVDQDVFFDNVKAMVLDSDGDGIPDVSDNCPAVYNPVQSITIAITGDVDNTGVINAADIIYMVNHVFKGAPAPIPCSAAGDVNCSGNLTAADIIYMVAFVFKSGPAPCNVCLAFGLGWTCP